VSWLQLAAALVQIIKLLINAAAWDLQELGILSSV
jgi:hypothetical protein